MKFFYWLVRLTDYSVKPPIHHGWKSALHPVGGPMSPQEVALAMLPEIRRVVADEAMIQLANWQLVEMDEAGGAAAKAAKPGVCRACSRRRKAEDLTL